jgi:cytochrome c5
MTRMMPAKGGNAGLKDNEVQAAIDYMVSKSS